MKKVILSLFIILSVLANTGCVKENKTADKIFEKETHITDSATNIKIDAEVHIPESIKDGTAPRGTGKAFDFLQQMDFLDATLTDAEKTESEEGYWNYEGDFVLSVSSGEIYFGGKLGDEVASCLQLDKSTDVYSGDLFEQKSNLSFRTYQDTYEEITSLFRELGVEVLEEYSCYSMNYETMCEVNQKFADAGDETARTVWSQDEECYYFRFQNSFQGIPVIGKENTFMAVDPGDDVNVIYSKNGYERLVLFGCYDIQSTENVPLISASEALETLKRKYKDLLIDTPVEVNHIELCLYADTLRLEEEKAEIYPVWSFNVVESEGNPEQKVLVDAQTGKEVLITL